MPDQKDRHYRLIKMKSPLLSPSQKNIFSIFAIPGTLAQLPACRQAGFRAHGWQASQNHFLLKQVPS
jgi:hypothetical protein